MIMLYIWYNIIYIYIVYNKYTVHTHIQIRIVYLIIKLMQWNHRFIINFIVYKSKIHIYELNVGILLLY